MNIKDIVSFIFIGFIIIGLFVLLVWSMKSTMKTENELKKKQIEFYNAVIKWCRYYTDDSDEE